MTIYGDQSFKIKNLGNFIMIQKPTHGMNCIKNGIFWSQIGNMVNLQSN